MNIVYWKSSQGNFGDDLNQWLWDELLPGWQSWSDELTLLGVGTLVNQSNLAKLRGRKTLILGSGVGYGAVPKLPLDPLWEVRALRGRQSARLLGLPEDRGITDPATMLSELPYFQNLPCQGGPVFVPHIGSIGLLDWQHHCAEAGLGFVSPQEDARSVITRIAQAPLVLAESMHAAIIADSFRVPWIPVHISGQFNHAKWQDFFLSIGHDQPIPSLFAGSKLFPSKLGPLSLRNLARKINAERPPQLASASLAQAIKCPAYLSPDAKLQGLKQRYHDVLGQVRRDYGETA